MINHRPHLATILCSEFTTLWDLNEPTHCLKRIQHGVLGVVAGLHLSWGRDLLQDHSNRLTLLQYPYQKLNW